MVGCLTVYSYTRKEHWTCSTMQDGDDELNNLFVKITEMHYLGLCILVTIPRKNYLSKARIRCHTLFILVNN